MSTTYVDIAIGLEAERLLLARLSEAISNGGPTEIEMARDELRKFYARAFEASK